MADWISASTTDFWLEATDTLYLGDGEWSLTTTGAQIVFKTTGNSILDADKSVWGVRFNFTGGGDDFYEEVKLEFSIYGEIDTIISASPSYLLDEGDRASGEYILYIEPLPWFGSVNGYADLIVSDIEIYTDWVAEEPEEPGSSHLYKNTGRTEVIVPIEPPIPEIEPEPPPPINPIIPGPPIWGSDPIPRPPGTPIPDPGNDNPGAPTDNLTTVPCVTSDGESGYSVWLTDDQGNLIKQLGPCIPISGIEL